MPSPHITPAAAHFCGGCGQLQPIEDERELFGPHQELVDSTIKMVYKCSNCGTSSKVPYIVGYFDPAELERLRCL